MGEKAFTVKLFRDYTIEAPTAKEAEEQARAEFVDEEPMIGDMEAEVTAIN